jgi:hypothetical protein
MSQADLFTPAAGRFAPAILAALGRVESGLSTSRDAAFLLRCLRTACQCVACWEQTAQARADEIQYLRARVARLEAAQAQGVRHA